jgi:predicted phosphodiesterase
MKILVLSDIHGNLSALNAVLEDTGDVDAVWCLGDIVGYGPDPNECVSTIREIPNCTCLQGNHDRAAVGLIDTTTFNPEAQTALHWTKNVLASENRAFLLENPNRLEKRDVTLAHGSPRQPVWEYIMDVYTASVNFEYFDTDYCFVGHTHLPALFTMEEHKRFAKGEVPPIDQEIQIPARSILNPGSVGQPRDEDPRASYAVYDPEQHIWLQHRISYPVQEVQDRMRVAGLPDVHIQRLEMGW